MIFVWPCYYLFGIICFIFLLFCFADARFVCGVYDMVLDYMLVLLGCFLVVFILFVWFVVFVF